MKKYAGIGLTVLSIIGGLYSIITITDEKGNLFGYNYEPPYTSHEAVIIALLVICVVLLLVGFALWAIGASEEPSVNGKSSQYAVANVPEEIRKYKELLDAGVITQEEYEAKKKELMGL